MNVIDFSVIIPAKNEEANIGRCLDSINSVDYDHARFEVIVVDNGSTDRTVEVAREKGATVFVKPDLTISGLRNFGALSSSGKILAFLDADCSVDSKWLSAASLYLNETDGVSAFGSPVVIPVGATWVQKAWFNVRGKPNLIMDVTWLESANLFVKREALFSVNGFNEALITCEDYDLTQRLKGVGRLVSDYRVMAIHYREPATVSEFIRKEIWRGKSNYTGLLNRKVDLAEIPSLVLPVVYGFFMLAVILIGTCAILSSINCLWLMFCFLFIWQLPMLYASIRKGKAKGLATIYQIYLLFNAYFLARSISLIRRS